MIRLRWVSLPAVTLGQLQALQREIDRAGDYAARVSAAKVHFGRNNTSTNPTFTQVRKTLTTMCSGARRCIYCEDSCADEVEHIKPKDLYPDAVFVWENYLYACGPCNGPKNNKFSVFSSVTGAMIDVTRKRSAPLVEPEPGSPVLINPRFEDPLRFMELDLLGTFLFLPSQPKGSKGYDRARYTIDVLRLNDRDVLLKARKEAYYSYEGRLSQYITLRKEGYPLAQLKNRVRALKRMQHPTVWKEMKRQHKLIASLKELFEAAPEALNW